MPEGMKTKAAKMIQKAKAMRMMVVKKKKKGSHIKIKTRAAVSEEDCPRDESRASAKRHDNVVDDMFLLQRQRRRGTLSEPVVGPFGNTFRDLGFHSPLA